VAHYRYSRAELLAMTVAEIRQPADVPRLLDNIAGVADGGFDRAGTRRHRRREPGTRGCAWLCALPKPA
jgi:hypothetical protein